MIKDISHNFPATHHYLICQADAEQINLHLMQKLVQPFHKGRKHSLWSATARQLPDLGRQIGWVPNKLPGTFLSETVVMEIADAYAAPRNSLKALPEHIRRAEDLLQRLQLSELAQRNPFSLSEGETKLVWLLTQWAKKPDYLIIGYLPTSLSPPNISRVLDFLMDDHSSSGRQPVLIFGCLANHMEWCRPLLECGDWEVITWESSLI
ncbi:MAG: hypothetical protein ONB16_07415 [candidate division KSB1 bacterium]|nr:hypothetical protein [candidate division KSB1 bacterium]MDZ7319028.1 hypothetical protein [candidate division KSB1 bacterium]